MSETKETHHKIDLDLLLCDMQRSSLILFCCDLIENGGVFNWISFFLKQNMKITIKMMHFFPINSRTEMSAEKKTIDFKGNRGAKKMTPKKLAIRYSFITRLKKNHISLKNHFFLSQSIIFYLKCFQTKKKCWCDFFLYFFACECQFPSEQHMAKSKRFFNIFVLHKQIVTWSANLLKCSLTEKMEITYTWWF